MMFSLIINTRLAVYCLLYTYFFKVKYYIESCIIIFVMYCEFPCFLFVLFLPMSSFYCIFCVLLVCHFMKGYVISTKMAKEIIFNP